MAALSVDRFIDYKNEDFKQILTDYDLVLDPIGGKTQEKSFFRAKKRRPFNSLVQEPNQEKAYSMGITGTYFSMPPTSERLQKLAKLQASGAIKPVVTQTYAPSQKKSYEKHMSKQKPAIPEENS